MKIIFVGTGAFGVPALKQLLADKRIEIPCIVTQPDKPKGRGLKNTQSPIKELALEHKIPVFQPKSINKPDSLDYLKSLVPQLIIVAAYGQKLKQAVLELPALGCFNIHASLLPKYRGAAPINYAILEGETTTGVTIFKMEETMDTGAILNQKSLTIAHEETAGELSIRLAGLAAETLEEAINLFIKGNYQLKPQNESQVSLAPKLTKESGLINWVQPAKSIANQVRALQPWPGTYTFWHRTADKPPMKLNITKVALSEKAINNVKAGIIIGLDKGIEVATGSGTITIMMLQPADHRVMSAQAFINGYHIKIGDIFAESE
jgi:methionyl-tRNA formyltransferase